MVGLELLVAVAAVVLVGTVIGRRLHISPPVVLLACGVIIGLLPTVGDVQLPPDVVLLIFLPALLFWESLTISLQQVRQNFRGIALAGTVLVVLSAGAVAVVAHTFGLPWGPAWILGAAVAPTDATAVAVLGRLLPFRRMTALRAESLVNDGTALVLYSVAVTATISTRPGALSIAGQFVASYLVGIAIGLAVAYAGFVLRRTLADPLLGNTATVLVPFVAYLVAEELHGSGVLAVVTAGIVLGQAAPRIGRSATRHQSETFWTLVTFWLNAALFVLVGARLPSVVEGLSSSRLGHALLIVMAVVAVLVVVRVAFVFASSWLIAGLDRRRHGAGQLASGRYRLVSGLAGFRGAISLAIALSVPEFTDAGAPLPFRDTVIFVTAGVIVVTLAQGLVLPRVVRWAGFAPDTDLRKQRKLAETAAEEAALDALPQFVDEQHIDPAIGDQVRLEIEQHLLHLTEPGTDQSLSGRQEYLRLRLALIGTKRAAILRLRDERTIDDTVLRTIQSTLDLEELRLKAYDTRG
ncbi:Na+/H+ antiporter [Flexivirga meconopsidis]|uniref:Na+/H+ antiporter n=1 Tax=Flexivirga meconopsidis TaxID=2977121 RepID=UPI00223FEF6F|nr:Na+/H+ antiporter [Flexivirga meconopsidis]